MVMLHKLVNPVGKLYHVKLAFETCKTVISFVVIEECNQDCWELEECLKTSVNEDETEMRL